jgi:hypothetical protein
LEGSGGIIEILCLHLLGGTVENHKNCLIFLVPQARFETVFNASLEHYVCTTLMSACVGKCAGRCKLIILK